MYVLIQIDRSQTYIHIAFSWLGTSFPQENKQLRDALDEAKIMRKALEQAVAIAMNGGRCQWPLELMIICQWDDYML